MNFLQTFFTLAVFLFGAFSAAAQMPPPALSVDYSPEKWKEFTYQSDSFKIRFPKAPKISSIAGQKTETTSVYSYKSFVALQIRVTTFPFDLEEKLPVKEFLAEMLQNGLNAFKDGNPKVVKEKDIIQNGKIGKFYQIETDDGAVLRMKFFVVGSRVYYMFTETKKGDKHGINWENDFEKVAMGFLDSFELI